MLLAASPTTPSAARRAATPVEASLATAAVVVAAMVAAAVVVVVNVRCSPLCAPTVAMTPRCRSARAVTGRSTAAIVSVACETKRGVVPLFAGVLKHLAVHSLTMAARCTFWFCAGCFPWISEVHMTCDVSRRSLGNGFALVWQVAGSLCIGPRLSVCCAFQQRVPDQFPAVPRR